MAIKFHAIEEFKKNNIDMCYKDNRVVKVDPTHNNVMVKEGDSKIYSHYHIQSSTMRKNIRNIHKKILDGDYTNDAGYRLLFNVIEPISESNKNQILMEYDNDLIETYITYVENLTDRGDYTWCFMNIVDVYTRLNHLPIANHFFHIEPVIQEQMVSCAYNRTRYLQERAFEQLSHRIGDIIQESLDIIRLKFETLDLYGHGSVESMVKLYCLENTEVGRKFDINLLEDKLEVLRPYLCTLAEKLVEELDYNIKSNVVSKVNTGIMFFNNDEKLISLHKLIWKL